MAAKCKVIDLTMSDSDSDSNFCTYRIHFCIKFLYIKISITSSSCYNGNYFTELAHVCSNVL